jgi:hypothetical protein
MMNYFKKMPHALLMFAACAAMLAAIFILTPFTVDSNWGVYLLLFICPAMHIFMHRGMHRNKDLRELSKISLSVINKQEVYYNKPKEFLE